MIFIPSRIPIRIFPFFWFLILMIGWISSETILGTLIWAIVILISVLVHEFGHALTAMAFGQKAEIDLVGLGGLTRRSGEKIKPWQEFLVVLNGPLAGFLFFLFISLIQPFFAESRFTSLSYALFVGTYVNLVWNILNLMPVQPLDGGHLLRIILEKVWGFKGLKGAYLISVILASLFGIGFFINQSFLAGSLFLLMAFESYKAWSELQGIAPQDTDANLKAALEEAQELIKTGQTNEALSKLFYLRDQSKEGILFITATQLIARLLAEQGHVMQAYEWLLPIEKQLSPDYQKFLQQLAYRLQEWEHVVKIGTRVYQDHPNLEAAFLNALAYAIMGQSKQSIGWLRCAKQLGLTNLNEIIKKREFDSIRQTPEFQSLLKQLG